MLGRLCCAVLWLALACSHASAEAFACKKDDGHLSEADVQRNLLVRHARELREKQHMYAEALWSLEQIPSPLRDGCVLTEIASVEEAFGHNEHDLVKLASAYAHYREALADADNPYVRERAATIRQLMAGIEPSLARLIIHANPADAALELVPPCFEPAQLGRELLCAPGPVDLHASHPNYRAYVETVELSAGALVSRTLELVPVVTPPHVIEPEHTLPPVVPGVVTLARYRSPLGKWMIGAAAVGAAVALSGIAPWLRASHRVDLLRDDCAFSGGRDGCADRTLAGERHAIERLDRVTNAVWISGVVLATAALLVPLVAPRRWLQDDRRTAKTKRLMHATTGTAMVRF